MIDIPVPHARATLKAIGWSTQKLYDELNPHQLDAVVQVLVKAFHAHQNVFVCGVGRSLLVGKAFAMRLMHLGFKSYVIGDITTPAVGSENVVMVISKTLSDPFVSVAMSLAKQQPAKIILVTSVPESSFTEMADFPLIIPDLKSRAVRRHKASLPLGTLFEVSVMIVLDGVVAELMERLGITETEMRARHANIQS